MFLVDFFFCASKCANIQSAILLYQFCLPVRLSGALWYCIQTNSHVLRVSLTIWWGITPVFQPHRRYKISRGTTSAWALNALGKLGKIWPRIRRLSPKRYKRQANSYCESVIEVTVPTTFWVTLKGKEPNFFGISVNYYARTVWPRMTKFGTAANSGSAGVFSRGGGVTRGRGPNVSHNFWDILHMRTPNEKL